MVSISVNRGVFFIVWKLALILMLASCAAPAGESTGGDESEDPTHADKGMESPGGASVSDGSGTYSLDGEWDLKFTDARFTTRGGGEGTRENEFGQGENEFCGYVHLESKRERERKLFPRFPQLKDELGYSVYADYFQLKESGFEEPVKPGGEVEGEMCWYTDVEEDQLAQVVFWLPVGDGDSEESEIEIDLDGIEIDRE